MPNWCENTMVVTGRKNHINSFYDHIYESGSGEFRLLESFMPTPPELMERSSDDSAESEELRNKYGYSDWYSWRLDNWGTKWDVCHARMIDHIKHDDVMETMVFVFDTAWSPPVEGLSNISSMCENLYFYLEFKEAGMAFQGYSKFHNGEVTENLTVEMYENTDSYIEMLDFNLDRFQETTKE